MCHNKKKLVYILVTTLVVANLLIVSAFAYSLDPSWVYDDPQSVSVYISSSVPYISDVTAAYDNWNGCPEVYCYRSYNVNYQEAYIAYSAVNTGAVAETSIIGNSDWKQIIIRPYFNLLTSSVQREETIAHELGHCLGLNDIYDEDLMPDTLMRGEGFNNCAFPYDDDEAGIAALYS